MLVSSSRNRHDFAKSRETREFAYAVTSLSCFDHEGCHRQPLEMTRIHFQSGSKIWSDELLSGFLIVVGINFHPIPNNLAASTFLNMVQKHLLYVLLRH
jgi:hypothetical protein